MSAASVLESADTAASTVDAMTFHVGLNVTDLELSVRFYSTLFDTPPTRNLGDYARFVLTEPPLVLALYPSPQTPGGALNHVGLRFRTSAELVDVQRRLEQAGIRTQRQEDVECCYSRQTKFWVTDPDRNLWEIYTLHEDLDHSGFNDPPAPEQSAPQAVWEHRLTEPIPQPLPFADGSLDEIRLEGTFNSLAPMADLASLLAEAYRTLKPRGRLVVHGLVSDRPFPGPPRLPGMAAVVQRVPVETEPSDMLQNAGFVDLFLDKQGDIHCFQVAGVQLRELRLSGVKPATSTGEMAAVIYKGPYAEIELDHGILLKRGERTMLPRSVAERLASGPVAGSFGVLKMESSGETR